MDIVAGLFDQGVVEPDRRVEDYAVAVDRRAELRCPDPELHAAEDTLVFEDPPAWSPDTGVEPVAGMVHEHRGRALEASQPAIVGRGLGAALDPRGVSPLDRQSNGRAKDADLGRRPDRPVVDEDALEAFAIGHRP